MRIGYVLWLLAAVGWIVLAVLSDDPMLRWGFAAAAALAVLGAVIGWRQQGKKSSRNAKGSEDL
ncbi:hypothetical protein [Kocuria kalidii]|uniref:hypothetical protein n=1 Tax=Kocuria kalidii TaxID=3376283 RepID=UPI0037B84B3B